MVIRSGSSLGEKYVWTSHARMKMRHYRLTESRIKRIIRHPARVEEGILEDAIACMQPASAGVPADKSAKNYSEIWAMYVVVRGGGSSSLGSWIKIITCWRYPGRSTERDPIPESILREIKTILI